MSNQSELLEQLLQRLNEWMPRQLTEDDWNSAVAFRWRRKDTLFGKLGYLQAVKHTSNISFDDLQHIDRQKNQIYSNTKHFVEGKPANNVLLTGARGTGKSSLIKASLNEFATQSLRLVEVDKEHLTDLGDLTDLLADGESGYKSLKSALDGSVAAQVDNILIYATSNRRHLLPEYMKDNESYRHTSDGEIHPGEVVEEKISLSERFGLWISFYPPKQDEYLDMVAHWLKHFGLTSQKIDAAKPEALIWALERGSRSGRVAWQFARHWAGQES